MLCQNVIDLYSLLTNTLTNLEWAPYSQIYSQTWNGLLTHRHTHKPGIGSLLTDILTNMEWTPCSQTYSPTWNGHIPTHSYKPGMCSLLTDILTNLEWAPYSQTWNGLLTHTYSQTWNGLLTQIYSQTWEGLLTYRHTQKLGKGSSLTDTFINLRWAPHSQIHSQAMYMLPGQT